MLRWFALSDDVIRGSPLRNSSEAWQTVSPVCDFTILRQRYFEHW